jgi:hypothetical protein
MENKRQHVLKWKSKLSTPFVIVSVCGMLLFTLVFGLMASSIMSNQLGFGQADQSIWRVSFLAFILIQLGANVTLLVIIFATLHRTIGAFPRLEQNLDKVIAGDYTVRVGLRNKDNEHVAGLVTKINKVLEILEQKSK